MKILIAEDEKAMSDALAAMLKHFGYEVDAVYDGLAATEKARENSYSCMIFDIMMPKIDGIEALKRIRDSGDMTPVIMLTAKSEVEDRIMGLDAGADDYLVKPFAVEELLARIRAVTRRPGRTADTTTLTFGSLSLDAVKHELTREGAASETVTLSGRESSLLEYLMRNAGRTLPRNAILSYVWGPDSEVEAGNLDNYIYFLRRRLKALHGNADGPWRRLPAGGIP